MKEEQGSVILNNKKENQNNKENNNIENEIQYSIQHSRKNTCSSPISNHLKNTQKRDCIQGVISERAQNVPPMSKNTGNLPFTEKSLNSNNLEENRGRDDSKGEEKEISDIESVSYEICSEYSVLSREEYEDYIGMGDIQIKIEDNMGGSDQGEGYDLDILFGECEPEPTEEGQSLDNLQFTIYLDEEEEEEGSLEDGSVHGIEEEIEGIQEIEGIEEIDETAEEWGNELYKELAMEEETVSLKDEQLLLPDIDIDAETNDNNSNNSNNSNNAEAPEEDTSHTSPEQPSTPPILNDEGINPPITHHKKARSRKQTPKLDLPNLLEDIKKRMLNHLREEIDASSRNIDDGKEEEGGNYTETGSTENMQSTDTNINPNGIEGKICEEFTVQNNDHEQEIEESNSNKNSYHNKKAHPDKSLIEQMDERLRSMNDNTGDELSKLLNIRKKSSLTHQSKQKDIKKVIKPDASILNYGSFLTGKILGCNLMLTNISAQDQNIEISIDQSTAYTKRFLLREFLSSADDLGDFIGNSERKHGCWFLESPKTKDLVKNVVLNIPKYSSKEVLVVIRSPHIKLNERIFSLINVGYARSNISNTENKIVSFESDEEEDKDNSSRHNTRIPNIPPNKRRKMRILLHGRIQTPKLICPRQLNNKKFGLNVVPIVLHSVAPSHKLRIPFKNNGKMELDVDFNFMKNEGSFMSNYDYFCIPNQLKIPGNGGVGILNILIKNNTNTTRGSDDEGEDSKILMGKIKDTSIVYTYYLEASIIP